MLLDWLDAREATTMGTTLADDFVTQAASTRPKKAGLDTGSYLEKFAQKFLPRVDREARPLKLNLFKRAKLANSFKWRLLEKGVAREVADELTHALLVRLSADRLPAPQPAAPAPSDARRAARGALVTLLTEGNQALARGDHTEAIRSYEAALARDSRHPEALNNLGAALCKLGRYAKAEEQFRLAIAARANYADAHCNLGTVLRLQGRVVASELPLRRALKLKPAYLAAQVSLGMTLLTLGRLRDATVPLERALKVAPRDVDAIGALGQIAALEGRFDDAEALYKRALDVDANAHGSWAALARLRRMTPADGAWLKGAEACATRGLTPHDEADVRFALGKYYDDVGDFKRAFRSYQRANELHKLAAEPYDRGARTRFVDDLIRAYTSETIGGTRGGASDSMRPVFVVGMPRSGTTLVAQIIHSHAAARSAGELAFWPDAVHKHAATLLQGPPDEALTRKLATGCLGVLAGRFPDPLRVVDKTPFNSDYLGVIHSVFPKARIIYLQRDPIDACLSCYFQPFLPSLNFSMDLSDLAHYYHEHRRLMDHWRRVLPPEILLEVPYAGLVDAQEEWTRRIVDFLGLPWDPGCLESHTTERVVRTASYWQVRQPIYKDSVGRWHKYEKFIGPLLDLRDRTPA
jgi:tetratricopeptide (TPR) repeat protein